MIAATTLAIFIVPVLYVAITKVAYGKRKLAEMQERYNPNDHAHFAGEDENRDQEIEKEMD